MKVSIQGALGSYHNIVALDVFGKSVECLYADSFPQVFDETLRHKAEYGIIAIENSIVGSLHENYDLLTKFHLRINGERYLRISHNLMALPGVRIKDLKEIQSHPIALRQCRQFLSRYPKIKIVETHDTAASAAAIKEEGRRDCAAIASEYAARIHGMEILARSIETNKKNYTRFFIISHNAAYDESSDKTSIVFTAADKPGSLGRVFNLFSDKGINISKIESRPILGAEWQYYFYLDFEAGLQDPKSHEVLREIYEFIDFMRILGSYPKGSLIDMHQLTGGVPG